MVNIDRSTTSLLIVLIHESSHHTKEIIAQVWGKKFLRELAADFLNAFPKCSDDLETIVRSCSVAIGTAGFVLKKTALPSGNSFQRNSQ